MDKHTRINTCVCISVYILTCIYIYTYIYIHIYIYILIGIKRAKLDYINKFNKHISLFCYQVYVYIYISLACSGVKHEHVFWTDLRYVCHHSDVSFISFQN